MPWDATDHDKNSLKNQATQKFFRGAELSSQQKRQVNDSVNYLLRAKSMKQAEAVLGAVESRDDLKNLTVEWYKRLENNDAKTIKKALKPEVREEVRGNLTESSRINGYLEDIIKNKFFKQHREGANIDLEQVNKENEIAKVYANAEGKLKRGDQYIEWYAKVDNKTRSKEKRFFTAKGKEGELWYTEDGTHGTAKRQKWWHRMRDGDVWKEMP
jgi:hypothetical protein